MDDNDKIEDIDALLAGEEPAKPPKTPKLSKLPAGQMVAAIMDAAGVPMTAEERQEIVEISDDEAMKAFLEANLGKESFVGELKARSLFGSYMMKKMNHKAIGFAARYLNIASTQKCIEFAEGLVKKDGATIEEQTNAGKLWLVANREMSVMLKRYDDLAQQYAPDDKPVPSKNSGPNIFVENGQILVQSQPSTSTQTV